MDPYPPEKLLLLWMLGKIGIEDVISHLLLIIIALQEQIAVLKSPSKPPKLSPLPRFPKRQR